MKRYNYILVHIFVALVLTGIMSACLREHLDPNGVFGMDESLALRTTVSEGTVITRATTPSVGSLKENYLHTLDVFVEHVKNGTGEGTFICQYHLPLEGGNSIQEEVKNLLSNRWSEGGIRMNEYYNVYVATNNSQTKGTKDLSTFNVEALKELVADEVTDGIAIINEDNNNVTWGSSTTSGNIYKLYDANPGSSRALTSEKEFMMDGVITNWTPDPTTSDQIFQLSDKTPLPLSRAASKFVVNVNFDADFLMSLTHTKNADNTWTPKPDAEKVTIDGSPAWKFNNFAFGAPVFTPATQGAGVEVHNSDFNIFHNQSYTGEDKHFTITTYSYPNKWAAADYATAAPSLVISVGFLDNGATTPNYHYYRIPLVKSTVTAIERNHIYVVNATIATRGSSPTEDQDLTENIQYAVLPWNDAGNTEATSSEVQSVQHYYFNVNPKVYTLRGDGDQTVILNYSKATGTRVGWKLFTYDEEGNQTGVVANNASGAVRAWFYDAEDKFITTYGDGNPATAWPNMGVTITQSEEGTSGSKGTVTVTSKALTNKAIKYIRLRVYLNEEATFDANGETMYEDIIIRHFPTDNIQSIKGNWSSYYDPDQATAMTIYKTRSLTQAQSLAAQYNVTFTSEDHTETEVINYATWNTNQNVAGYNRTVETIQRSVFTQNVTQYYRQGANSEANARQSDNYYYWGEGPNSSSSYSNDYDWRTGGWISGYTYYRYTSYHRARYTHTYTYTEYTLELPLPSTGDWVDWDAPDASEHEGQRTYQYSYTSNDYSRFYAKVYNGGKIYYMNDNHINGNRYRTEQGDDVGLTNNRMYVIQISATSDDYVLGRPYVNTTTHQSQDNVVSPAFMIASQLGAVTTFTGNNAATNAATHCSRYMEVSGGIRYTGWRLPTAAEIRIITDYQYGNIDNVTIPSQYQVLTPVLTGRYYWSLSGELILTRTNNNEGNFLRCVRDLTAEEVERLNGFEAIQEKYR